MTILNQLNSAPMYLICGGIIAFVAVVCVIFLIRAYRAGKALGMDETKMKRTRLFQVQPFRYCRVLEFCWESLHFPEVWEHRGRGFVFP